MNPEPGSIRYAVVEDNHLDAEGRILVMISYGASESRAVRARICALGAGSDRGLQFLPEVKDQVLVAFVNGAPEEPIVVGGLWSRKSAPPQANDDGLNQVKVIKTISGHVIRLTDTKGKEKIEVITPKGGKVTINSEQITLDGDVTVTGKLIVGRTSKTTIDGNTITGT